MNTILFRIGVILFLWASLVAGGAIALGKEPEEIWQQLSKLSREEREKRLIAGAKTEGKVVLYGNLSADHLEKVKVDFEKRYAVKLDAYRASGERIANRVLTEFRAGKFEADVVGPSNEHVPALMKAGVLGRYASPERAAYFDTHKDRQGYWTAYDYNVAIIAYNTRLVTAGDVPKKYEDFLDAKWKGNFAIDMDPDKSLTGWLKIWGPEKTKKYLQAITKNEVVVRKGHTLLTQLLCAGEFKGAIDLYAYRVADLKNTKGCPVEISYPDPTPATPSPLSVTRKAPHPFSAALLDDYLLSDIAQKIFLDAGRISGRRGLRPKYPDIDIEAKGVRILLITPEDAVQLEKPYQQLREEFLMRR